MMSSVNLFAHSPLLSLAWLVDHPFGFGYVAAAAEMYSDLFAYVGPGPCWDVNDNDYTFGVVNSLTTTRDCVDFIFNAGGNYTSLLRGFHFDFDVSQCAFYYDYSMPLDDTIAFEDNSESFPGIGDVMGSSGEVGSCYAYRPFQLLRLMPLGDSITVGVGSPEGGGYRGHLFQDLTREKGLRVDYVGNEVGFPDQRLIGFDPRHFDPDHEGYSGWRIDNLYDNIKYWIDAQDCPDITAVHIGTNDFGQNFYIDTAKDRLELLIVRLARLCPYSTIIVTNLLERSSAVLNNQIETRFNPYVNGTVNRQVSLGVRAMYLDMRSAVPLNQINMPDGLHPSDFGYQLMTNAWALSIMSRVIFPPSINRIISVEENAQLGLAILFSQAMADSAADPSTYTISDGTSMLILLSAHLSHDKRMVSLRTNIIAGTSYTVTVNNALQDRTGRGLSVNTVSIKATRSGYQYNIPTSEVSDYIMALELVIPNSAAYGAAEPAYSIDNRTSLSPFTKIAYYFEIQTSPMRELQYVWVSMDAFTFNANQIGVPTTSTGATYQQTLSEMNIYSNVPNVTVGASLNGNIEFWPTNYSPINDLFDDNDQVEAGTYGSMQVHSNGKTVFAYNNWGAVSGGNGYVDIGIGENEDGLHPDWTFAGNGEYVLIKKLQVFVLPQKGECSDNPSRECNSISDCECGGQRQRRKMTVRRGMESSCALKDESCKKTPCCIGLECINKGRGGKECQESTTTTTPPPPNDCQCVLTPQSCVNPASCTSDYQCCQDFICKTNGNRNSQSYQTCI